LIARRDGVWIAGLDVECPYNATRTENSLVNPLVEDACAPSVLKL
jgi:hypothetical protein